MGPMVPFSFEEFPNSPLWQLVKTLINSILLKQILTLFTVYAIISYIKIRERFIWNLIQKLNRNF